jgi:glycerol-3-phosphate dehydrogenase
MTRDLARFDRQPFDVLVVGGGIHGLAVAYDAAQRGYSTALVERGDFGSGSSFNHAKTVHGGLRSLQTGDVAKARFSACERRAMARIAPHLVEPLSFMMATTRKLTRSTWALRAGFLLDATIGYDRNSGVLPRLRLASGRVVSRAEYVRLFGENARDEATGGGVWNDYHMGESDRLTLAFASAAVNCGAALANYVEALTPLKDGERISGMLVRDRLTGREFPVSARVTVNASGAHTRPFMQAFGAEAAYPLLKAMNVVTTRPAGPMGMGAPTSGGRLLLIMPWHGRMLIGTSHSDEAAQPDDAAVSAAELASFIAEINSAFPALKLSAADVALVHRGVVPAEPDRRGVLGLMGHHRVHDHASHGVEGAVSVVGVKYTTGRGVGEQVVDLVGRKLEGRTRPCRSGTTRLPGAGFDDLHAERQRAHEGTRALWPREVADALVGTHGTAWSDIATLAQADPALRELIPGTLVPAATIVYAVRQEMAVALGDVLLRRTGLGSAGYPGEAVVDACAQVIAGECGWDGARAVKEKAEVKAFYAPVSCPRGDDAAEHARPNVRA